MNNSDDKCLHCGGRIAVRNPSGECDHLCWPDNLTDAARLANGYVLVEVTRSEWQNPTQPASALTDF